MIARILREYRPMFTTRRLAVRLVCADTDWMGMFLPGTRSDTILINEEHCRTEEQVRSTVLHELIHAEQHKLGLPLDHDDYFNTRAESLRSTTGIQP